MQLSKKAGENLEITCPNCDTTKEYHVNSIKAKQDKRPLLGSVLVFIGTFLLYMALSSFHLLSPQYLRIMGMGAVIALPIIVYRKYSAKEKQSILRFNHYKLKTKVNS
jgi:hypothetical protein